MENTTAQQQSAQPEYNFRFSLGDSRTTGFGMCFTIRAATEAQAVEAAQEAIDGMMSFGLDVGDQDIADDVSIYVGPDLRVSKDDITDVTDDDGNDVNFDDEDDSSECPGGCGRELLDCASSQGAPICMDTQEYRDNGDEVPARLRDLVVED